MPEALFPLFSPLLLLLVNLGAFGLYWLDKKRARGEGRRVPEASFITLALLGGWPASFWAQRKFRHKTKKVSFQIKFWLATAGNIAALSYLLSY